MEEVNVKIGHNKGALWIQCPKCGKGHFGWALEEFLRKGIPVRCDGTNCGVFLWLHE